MNEWKLAISNLNSIIISSESHEMSVQLWRSERADKSRRIEAAIVGTFSSIRSLRYKTQVLIFLQLLRRTQTQQKNNPILV